MNTLFKLLIVWMLFLLKMSGPNLARTKIQQTTSIKRIGNKPRYCGLLHCGPGRIRTCDARFRKPTLYPLSYGAAKTGTYRVMTVVLSRGKEDQ